MELSTNIFKIEKFYEINKNQYIIYIRNYDCKIYRILAINFIDCEIKNVKVIKMPCQSAKYFQISRYNNEKGEGINIIDNLNNFYFYKFKSHKWIEDKGLKVFCKQKDS